MIERFHRQLKAAIRCHQDRWTESLPVVMLGIRSAIKEDLNATAAEMLYGQPLRTPGEFRTSRTPQGEDMSSAIFIKELRKQFQRLRPATVTRRGEKKIFVFKDLAPASHVFVRYDGPKQPLQLPYTGPYPAISRSNKSFVVNIEGKNSTITIDRLKLAYTLSETMEEPRMQEQTTTSSLHFRDQSGQCRLRIVPVELPAPLQLQPQPEPIQHRPPEVDVEDPEVDPRRTRAERQVRFPDRFQAG